MFYALKTSLSDWFLFAKCILHCVTRQLGVVVRFCGQLCLIGVFLFRWWWPCLHTSITSHLWCLKTSQLRRSWTRYIPSTYSPQWFVFTLVHKRTWMPIFLCFRYWWTSLSKSNGLYTWSLATSCRKGCSDSRKLCANHDREHDRTLSRWTSVENCHCNLYIVMGSDHPGDCNPAWLLRWRQFLCYKLCIVLFWCFFS